MKRDLLELFKRTGALQEGHFQLVSGRHSTRYFQCGLLFEDPSLSEMIFDELADKFKNDNVEYVIGIEESGSIISFEVAKRLNAKIIFARRKDSEIVFLPGFFIEKEKKVLIVDDVTTTGGTIKKLINLISSHMGVIAGIGLIASKGEFRLDIPYKIEVLTVLDGMDACPQSECQLCREGIPLINPAMN